jgi:hypothetical protein
MEIRLHGTLAEIESAAAVICSSFTILSERGDYPDRTGPLVRRYFTVLPPGFKVVDTATGEVQEAVKETMLRQRRRRR